MHAAGDASRRWWGNDFNPAQARNAQLLVAKVVDDDGSVSLEGEVDAIHWAVTSGARVINLSLGGLGTSTTIQSALTYAVGNGVFVAMAGVRELAPILAGSLAFTRAIDEAAARVKISTSTPRCAIIASAAPRAGPTFVSSTSAPTRSTAPWPPPTPPLPKPIPTSPTARTRPARLPAIIWCAPGTTPTGCPC